MPFSYYICYQLLISLLFCNNKPSNMKKLFTVLVIVLFAINVQAQETKPTAKAPVKKEACCAKKEGNAKKCAVEEKATCSADEKTKSAKASKSCCAKKA